VALAVYILSQHRSDVAAEYCNKFTGNTSYDWKPVIEELYLKCSIDQLVAYQLPEKTADKRVHHLARNWLAERSTALWVQEQNYSLGVAPSSSSMLDHYSSLCGVQEDASISIASRKGRRFCQRFRRAWGIRIGTLKVREAIPDTVIKEKVLLIIFLC
jgi:hypothetical protein